MTRFLDVEGALDIAGPGGGVTLDAEGAVLRCEVRSVDSGLALLRLLRAHAPAVRTLAFWLDRAGLCLQVRYRGRVVVEVGAGTAPTWFARRLGLPVPSEGKA